ncbi:MAG: saccharopine dehydrogenase family protein [Candidatus Bathyarchaeota archaeon]|nr:saccharopine dehydrogenase family protein [Candidatus Bathyarchaeota archaeon]MDH5746263.1 saccharopine dehydrogenase family protein [Candidatus Bathyarchaeota archaeon]
MKVLILGCGNIGSVAAEDIGKSIDSIEVVVADRNETRAKLIAEGISESNVSWIQLDAAKHNELVKTLEDFDLAMGFLPGKLGYRLAEACIDARNDLVDVSYMAENPLTLNDKAIKAGVTIIPDCGLAPGISNTLVGHAAGKFDKVQTVCIMVGGLPEKPVPPLGYVITWSLESLIDEYTRKARIVKEGEIVEVEALNGLEEIEFPNVGRLEAFYTDGLRTLPYTVSNVDNMWEKTLRYPGHAEKIKLLKALGFFDEKQINVEDVSLSPRKLTVKLFDQKLRRPEIRDIVAMKIEVSGIKNDKHMRYVYHMLDRYDENRGITAMARTTAYPASIIAQLMLKKAVKAKGVVPLERLGVSEEFFSKFLNELEKREIRITEEEKFAE